MNKGELILRCCAVVATAIMTVAVAFATKDCLTSLAIAFGGLYLSLREE